MGKRTGENVIRGLIAGYLFLFSHVWLMMWVRLDDLDKVEMIDITL